MKEIEIKILDIDPVEIEKKLVAAGAKKIFDEMFEEWMFDKPEWDKFRGRVRVRESSKKVELAYKETRNSTGDGNVEVEFAVSDRDGVLEFIRRIGIPLTRHQQKRRVRFKLKDVIFDLDYWPKLPPYLEVEADSRAKIEAILEKLGIKGRMVELDARQIYSDIYGISLKGVKELVFD